jgi:uncharacterized protein YbjT (DUF2867 family)
MSTYTALIAGSSGLTGSVLLKELLQKTEYKEVICINRKPAGISHSKLKEVILPDFENLLSLKNKFKADHYFCCLGTTIKKAGSKAAFRKVDYDYVVKLAEMALINDCKRFILVSSIGASKQSVFFYSRVKAEVESKLREMLKDKLIIFRPSLLMGNRKEKRFSENLAMKISGFLDPLLKILCNKYRATAVELLVKAMIIKALDKDNTESCIEAQYIREIAENAD